MIILFSPSEGKNPPQDTSLNTKDTQIDALFSNAKYKQKAIDSYIQALKQCDNATICKIFGTKTLKLEDLSLCQNLLKTPRMPAIELYSGVAYKALDFKNLSADSQHFLLYNVFICSNLFGFVRAGDNLPFYNLHQNKGFGAFELKAIYKAQKENMDSFLVDKAVLDLRAQAYIKVYEPEIPHLRAEFLHNGKALSHYAKHYRGLYLKELSKHYAKDSHLNLKNLEHLTFQNLTLKDINHKNHIKTLVYEIMQK